MNQPLNWGKLTLISIVIGYTVNYITYNLHTNQPSNHETTLSTGAIIHNKYLLLTDSIYQISQWNAPNEICQLDQCHLDHHQQTHNDSSSIDALEVAVSDLNLYNVVCDDDDRHYRQHSHSNQHKYTIHDRFSGGAYGDIYYARRVDSQPDTSIKYVLKRLDHTQSSHYNIYTSGLREIYFGELLHNQSHIVQYIENFEFDDSLWLVYEYGGISLYDYIYTLSSDNRRIPSQNWYEMKNIAHMYNNIVPINSESSNHSDSILIVSQCDGCVGNMDPLNSIDNSLSYISTPNDKNQLKSIIYQLLLSIQIVHAHNVTHRDIKPNNILLSHDGTIEHTSTLPSHEHHIPNIYVNLCDFGSAIDNLSLNSHILYPLYNYTLELQSTSSYSPPETIFTNQQYYPQNPYSYDIWSIGMYTSGGEYEMSYCMSQLINIDSVCCIVFLIGILIIELITGTNQIYLIDDKTRLTIDARLPNVDQSIRNNAYILRSMIEMCIYTTSTQSSYDKSHHNSIIVNECTESDFHEYIKRLDITHQGFDDIRLLRLVRQMLIWDPNQRISIDDALADSYFDDVREAN